MNKKFAFVKDNRSVCFQAPILISSAGHWVFVALRTSCCAACAAGLDAAAIKKWIYSCWKFNLDFTIMKLSKLWSDMHIIDHDCENIIDKKNWINTTFANDIFIGLKQQFLGIIGSSHFHMKKLTTSYAPRHFNVQNINWIKWEKFCHDIYRFE